MANWETYTISTVVSLIEDEEFVLPVIQRRLVWDEEKMELLFDTLLKGDSFGGIMVIKEDKKTKPLFAFRRFTKDGEPEESIDVREIKRTKNFVIDGQQRLQSLYIGLLGSIGGKRLFFDLFSNYDGKFEFTFSADEMKLPKIAKREETDKILLAYKWYSAQDLLYQLKRTGRATVTSRNISAEMHITEEKEKATVNENIDAFYRNVIGNQCLGVSEILLDKTFDDDSNRQQIVELFRQLNDGGTKLSPFDLIASVLKSFDWRMEGFLDDILETFSDIGLSQDNLIKLVFILQGNSKKEMAKIDSVDTNFAIKNKERIRLTLESLQKFLQFSELYNYYKDGSRSFIPLFFIAFHIYHLDVSDGELLDYFDNHDANNLEFLNMKKWIYYSLINGVFRSKGAGWVPYTTGIRLLLAKIIDHKQYPFPLEIMFKVYEDYPVAFTRKIDDANIIDDLDHQFLYYLMYDRKPTVRIQDKDHIMPKSILQKINFDSAKINSIKNSQLLDFGTNRDEKKAKPFRRWFSDFVKDKPGFLARHLIPEDETLWDEANFDSFSNERAKLIFSKIKSALPEIGR